MCQICPFFIVKTTIFHREVSMSSFNLFFFEGKCHVTRRIKQKFNKKGQLKYFLTSLKN